MGGGEIPGDAPGAAASAQPRTDQDPLGTLATVYGVERDLSHIALAITERLPAECGDIHLDDIRFEARFVAVFGIVAALVLDGSEPGPGLPGQPLAKFERTSMTASVSFHVGADAAEDFIEIVCREISRGTALTGRQIDVATLSIGVA